MHVNSLEDDGLLQSTSHAQSQDEADSGKGARSQLAVFISMELLVRALQKEGLITMSSWQLSLLPSAYVERQQSLIAPLQKVFAAFSEYQSLRRRSWGAVLFVC